MGLPSGSLEGSFLKRKNSQARVSRREFVSAQKKIQEKRTDDTQNQLSPLASLSAAKVEERAGKEWLTCCIKGQKTTEKGGRYVKEGILNPAESCGGWGVF